MSLQLAKLQAMTQAAQSIQHHALRETWLLAAVEALRPVFAAKGYVVPECKVSVGFASTGNRLGHIGQCWPTNSSDAQINQIFISPTLGDAFNVLDTLVHELVHAVDDCQHKHGKEFKKIAIRMGLQGPMRSAGAGDALKAQLQALAPTLGYEAASLIAKHAQEHNLSVKQSASQLGFMTEEEFDAILGDVDRITGRG